MRESTTFDEFWPEYVRAHRHPVNRALHYVGTSAAIGCVAASVLTLRPAWLLAAPVVGYGPAWIGHFFFEKNKPATFEYPLWSLRADLKMLTLAVRGRMGEELRRHAGEPHPTHAEPNGARATL
jgi:hypothetical protein